MNDKRRVVVTGLGIVSALGLDDKTFWDALASGKSGIAGITAFDVTAYKCRCGSEVDTALFTQALQARKIPLCDDRTVDFALLASAQALDQAGIIQGPPPYSPCETATILGTGVGASHSLFNCFTSFAAKGLRGLRPSSVPRCMANAVSSQVSMRFRLTGPNYVIVSACTSATTAIGIGWRMIRDGLIDRVLCGGSDAPFDPFVFGGWNNLGVMSSNPEPARACRPFDSARDGCILGEGASVLVLESLDSARTRGARIRGEICGFGESSDAEHITRPSPEGQARAIRAALASAGMAPADIGFINAHGTATKANDECEAQSIRLALGPDADRIPVASNKSFFGHLLGAAGAIETLATLLALENSALPPNLNLDHPDPACHLNLVGKTAAPTTAAVAMKNSFGFGGNNAVLILKRFESR